jgi:hypothetical protein
MSVDDIIDREASPADVARVATVIKVEPRFECFTTAVFAVRLLRLDQKLADGVPMNPRRMANILGVAPELLQEFIAYLVAKPGDETVTLFAYATNTGCVSGIVPNVIPQPFLIFEQQAKPDGDLPVLIALVSRRKRTRIAQ